MPAALLAAHLAFQLTIRQKLQFLRSLELLEVLQMQQSCLMPRTFNAFGDLEDYLRKFNTAPKLAGWFLPRHVHRPQYLALRLRDNTLHFYTNLSPEQHVD